MRVVAAAAFLAFAVPAAAQMPAPQPRPDTPNAAAPPRQETAPLQPMADWRSTDEVDRITGKRSVRVSTTQFSTTLQPNRRPTRTGQPGSFQFQCEGGRLSVYFYVLNELIASYCQVVQYRIDDRPPVTTRAWNSSTDSSAVGVWTHDAAVRLMRSLQTANRLLIRVQHDAFGQTEAEFNLRGIEVALIPIREACRIR